MWLLIHAGIKVMLVKEPPRSFSKYKNGDMHISTQINIAEIEEDAFNIPAEYSKPHIPAKFHIRII